MIYKIFDGMHLMDLTHKIHEGMTVYIGDPVPSITRVKNLSKDGVNLSKVEMGVHNGTHVDAPFHFIEGGLTVDQIPLQSFFGKAITLDFSDKKEGSAIELTDLLKFENAIKEDLMVLLYTGISKFWNEEWSRSNFTYLSKEGAKWLADKKVKLVGIDCLSIERYGSKGGETHKALLSKNIPIIESLNSNLSKLVGKSAFLICLPIQLQGTDGAPARVIALLQEE